MVLSRLVFSLMISATVIKSGRFEAFTRSSVRWQLVAMQSIGAASDLCIAGCICAGILRLRSGITASDKLVDKLVAFAVGAYLRHSIAALHAYMTIVV